MRKTVVSSVVVACVFVFVWVYHTEQTIERGRQAFARYGCASCHYAGGAPNLQNVGKKYDRRTLMQFLQDPETVYRARGNRPLNENFQPMPKLKLTQEDTAALVAYLRDLAD
jgi:mono/diheme cytochrome c family protein